MTSNEIGDENDADGDHSNTAGPNSWLVDEMYSQYLGNPRSVPEEWRQVFGEGPPAGAEPDRTPARMPGPDPVNPPTPSHRVQPQPAPSPQPAPTPIAPARDRKVRVAELPAKAHVADPPPTGTQAPAPIGTANGASPQPPAPTQLDGAPAPATAPAAAPPPAASASASASPEVERKPAPAPAQPQPTSAPTSDGQRSADERTNGDRAGGVAEPSDEPSPENHDESIRGVAARIAANMEASLDVPTATSFREVPAKLLEVACRRGP